MNKKITRFFGRQDVKLVSKFGIIFLVFLSLGWHRMDPDFGWHLTSGNFYRHNGIPSHDIYTYTAPNFPWINHEWGNDVLLSLFYSVGGYTLVSIFYAGLWTAAFSVRAARVRAIFLFAAAAAVLPYAGVRPVAWSFLFFAILLNLLERQKKPTYLSVALLFVLWANIHAGFIAGLGVIFYYVLKNRNRFYVKLLIFSFLATLVNPYGPRIYLEIGRTLFDSQLHTQITEWFSFVIFRVSYPFICLWGAGFLLYKRRPLKNWLGIGPVLFALTLSATRNLPLFVIATIKDLDGFYKEFRAEAPKKLNWAAKTFLGGAFVILAIVIGYFAYPSLLFGANREAIYPSQAANYLQAHPCRGNLFNDYDYGGYLIWKLPSERLYIDGRMSSWRDSTGKKYLTTYLDLLKDNKLRNQEFKRYYIQCVLMGSSKADFVKSLKKDGWHIVFQTQYTQLLEKNL